MELILLISAVIILLCVLFNKLTSKIGVPMLLAFIVLGMVFGSDGLFKIPLDNYKFVGDICSAALIFIMFYGGFGTKWSEARPVAVKALLLSSLGVIMTAGLTGLFCFWVLKFELLESLLIGSVIASTDAASVFSILRSKRLGLKHNTASLLELESGSNDPCAYMLTVILLSVLSGKGGGAGAVLYLVFAQVVYGAVIGVALALASRWFMRRFKFGTAGFDAAFVVALAILSYVLPAMVGGNGYLSAYIVGIVLGNTDFRNKPAMVHFFDGITGLMQVLIFFLLGLLSFPSKLPGVLLPSVLIALFLTFVARPAAVFALLTPLRCGARQQLLISWAGLRGAASIVFAILVTVSGQQLQNDIFHIVFFIVLLSIGFQGTLLPWVARLLKMTDANADALKTFNDYTDEVGMRFIQLSVSKNHPWCGKTLREITLLPDTLIVLVLRGGEKLIPTGSVQLQDGDRAVLTAPAFADTDGVSLIEKKIGTDSRLANKKLADCCLQQGELVVLILRGGRNIIPKGQTVIRPNDVLIIHSPTSAD